MLMDIIGPDSAEGSTRVWEINEDPLPQDDDDASKKVLRDISGPFACGKSKTCLPATFVSASSGVGELPFLLYLRHGTLELYAGSPLMLVQTSVYGDYPQASGSVGFAIEGERGVQLKVAKLKAWQMNLG